MTNDQIHPNSSDRDERPIDDELMPTKEPLTLDEIDEYMRRAKERAAQSKMDEIPVVYESSSVADVEEADASIDPVRLAQLRENFFPELPVQPRPRRLVQGIIFDFDNTLAHLTQDLEELMKTGAHQAEAYMRSTGMDDLPADFWESIVEARLFAATKSDDEAEEHTAEDTLSFLLQFFGYPASKMDPNVLRRAVDLFYAPEMTAWQPLDGAISLLERLKQEEIRLAIIANYPCDRVFQRIVDYSGLRPYFDTVLCSASVEWRKPGTEIYEIVLKRWDAEPYEIVCVGDSLKHDVAGGIEIGAQTIHCRMLPLAEDQRIIDTVTPDVVIESLDQIWDLVEAWS